MAEFITPDIKLEEQSFQQEEEITIKKNLEEMVEEQAEEIKIKKEIQEYVDEVSEEKEYMQPEQPALTETTSLKDIKPLVYDENDIPVVSDVFTRYGKKEDKWWLDKINAGVLK